MKIKRIFSLQFLQINHRQTTNHPKNRQTAKLLKNQTIIDAAKVLKQPQSLNICLTKKKN